jgi:hypothetical protein
MVELFEFEGFMFCDQQDDQDGDDDKNDEDQTTGAGATT